MNKQQLIKAIAKDTGLTQVAARAAFQSFERHVTEALADGETVKLVGFGTFKTTERDAHTARNPATGETVEVPAHTRVSFVPGKGLRDAIN